MDPYHVDRILSNAEKKVNNFIGNKNLIQIHDLNTNKLPKVKVFFEKHKSTDKDDKNTGDNDQKIFAQALTFNMLYFATTDGGFTRLTDEIECEFGAIITSDKNALEKLQEWQWD